MKAPFEGPLPDGWTGGEPVTKNWRGEFIHLYRVRRPCASCEATISIDVTKKALQGFSKNSGLLLKNCPDCRALRRAGGPGSRGGTSRPIAEPVEGAAPVAVVLPYSGNDAVSQQGAAKRIKELEAELLEAQNDHAATLHAFGMVHKAIHEQIGLSIIGEAINYDSVTAAISKLKGAHELPAAMLNASATLHKNSMPWETKK